MSSFSSGMFELHYQLICFYRSVSPVRDGEVNESTDNFVLEPQYAVIDRDTDFKEKTNGHISDVSLFLKHLKFIYKSCC